MSWIQRNFDTCYIVTQVWVDGFSVLLGAWLGFICFDLIAPGVAYFGAYRQLMVVVTAMCLGSFWSMGLYRWRKSILNVEEYRALFKAVLIAFVATATAIFLLQAAPEGGIPLEHRIYQILQPLHTLLQLDGIELYSRPLFVLLFLCIFFVMVLQRGIMFKLLGYLHKKKLGNTRVAVFGAGNTAKRLEKKLRLFPTLGYVFVGFLADEVEGKGAAVPQELILGGSDSLDSVLRKHRIQRVFIADPNMEEAKLVNLCFELEQLDIEYQVVPRLYHFFAKRYTVDNLDSLPLLTPPDKKRTRFIYHFMKRFMDLAITVPGLIAILPLLGVIALAVRKTSKGPALFQQMRVGYRGRHFRIYKFRSMYTDMCGDAPMPTSSRDPRVTPLGAFLRKTSLDDLPQLWNVIRGEMSLVGPRPEQPCILDEYEEIGKVRHDAKPGVTGLWQISDARALPIKDNLDYDLYYVENQSIFLDITIFALTIYTLIRVKHTV